MRHTPLVFAASLLTLLAACSPGHQGPAPLTPDEMRLLESPPLRVAVMVTEALPVVERMLADTERDVLANGRPLTADESALARTQGVAQPERVRVAVRAVFPMPDDPRLAQAARENDLVFGTQNEAGRTAGYAILLKPGLANAASVLAHELVHVGQYERLGGIHGFAQTYLTQLLIVGYRRAPLEVEAYARSPIL